MKKKILGIPCDVDEASGSVMADDGSITIWGTEGKEQSISIYDAELEKFAGFFEKYFCIILSINMTTFEEVVVNLDAIKFPERIEKLFLEFVTPTEILFTERHAYFENLRELTINDLYPSHFPDLDTFPRLETLTIQYDKSFNPRWTHLKNLRDLRIYNYSEADLSPLKDLINLRRLRLTAGKIKSLDGLERLPQLETLFIGVTPKLVDVNAIIKSKTLKNVMFESYKKIQDWAFLKAKKDLRCISLDTAASIDFMKEFSDLEFFFCKKVQDRKNKSFLFSTKLHQDEMTQNGIQVPYIPVCDEFYQPLDALNADRS